MNDGRFIDPRLGTLRGEGSQQVIERSDVVTATPESRTFPYVPEVIADDRTYYDLPLLKPTVWIWTIPTYLYAGGVAGATMTLGAVAQVAGGGELRPLVQRCRWIGMAGAVVSTACLVHDLGRPSRFLNMLRVFRPTSPMSVGSWVLTFFGSAAGAAAILSRAPGVLRTAGDAAGVAAGLLGMPLASYTSVLLSHTAVPVWQEARRAMPFLFIGSAISASASVLDFVPLSERAERVTTGFAIAGGLMELGGIYSVEQETGVVPRVGRPLRRGLPGTLWKAAKVLSAAGLMMALMPGKTRRSRQVSGVVGTLASLCVRFAIFHAGKASSLDPRASFQQQRAGYGAASVTGNGHSQTNQLRRV